MLLSLDFLQASIPWGEGDGVDGQLALIFRAGDRAYLVLAIEVEAQRIQTIRIVANPEKLVRV